MNMMKLMKQAQEMQAKALELLSDPNTDYSPVFPYAMEDNAVAVMQLFCGAGEVKSGGLPQPKRHVKNLLGAMPR